MSTRIVFNSEGFREILLSEGRDQENFRHLTLTISYSLVPRPIFSACSAHLAM